MIALPLAGLGDWLRSFADSTQAFLAGLASVSWGFLAAGLLLQGAFLTFHSRGWFNALRAAYPAERFRWRNVWAAYVVGMGVNSAIPARPGALARLYLAKQSVPNSSYPAVASTVLVEAIFDTAIGVLVILYAFWHGAFPDLPDLPSVALDVAWLGRHPDFALFALTALAVAGLVVVAVLSVRVKAFWAHIQQGLTILGDRPRYLRQVVLFQAIAWAAKLVGFWCFLQAFHIAAPASAALLAMAVQGVSSLVPFTPGGAGAQQALLAVTFAGLAPQSQLAAYSVGQQISISAFNVVVGLLALAFVFRTTDWRSLLRRAREDRAAAETS